MTTLHLTRYYGPHIGGVEKHVSSLLKELPKKEWSKVVITLQNDHKLPVHENIDGVEVYRLPLTTDADKLATWRIIWQLRHLFWQADVVHVHDVFWWLGPLYLFVSTKVYITFHGWEGQYPVPWQNKLQRLVYSQLAQGRIHVGQYIQEFYWDKPTAIVYGGVDLSLVKLPTQSSLKNKTIQLAFIGRLVSENEINSYCQVLKLLKKLDVKYQMTWIGDGPLANQCKKYGLVTGYLPNPQSLLAKANLVFANSYLAMLEAQAGGKIVVSLATNLLKESYIKFYPGFNSLIYGTTPREVAINLMGLITTPKIFRDKQLMGQKVAASQTWSKLAQVYLKLWNQDVNS